MKYTKLKNYIYPVLLLVIGIVLYLPLLKNQLLDQWDDQWAVMNEYTAGGFNVRNLWRILTEFYQAQYAPLNEYLYLTLYSLFGYNPMPYHLASMLLHLTNICLVYFVLRKLLSLTGRIENRNIDIISFLTALIFAVHPCNVEAVAWMSASKIPLYALFYLWATYVFLFFIEKGKNRYYVETLVLFVLSFLAKDQAITFPLWMLLMYCMLNHKLTEKKVWKIVAPFLVLSVIFGVITIMSQSVEGRGVMSEEAAYPIGQRLMYGCYSLFEYLTKSIYPYKLSYMYPFPNGIGEPLPTWIYVYPVLLVIIMVTLWKYISHGVLASGLIFFVIHIAMVLNIIQLSRHSMIADRYLYLALIGIGFILSYYFVIYYRKLKIEGKVVISVLLACYLFYFGMYSNGRIRDWYDSDTLKREIREIFKQQDDAGMLDFENPPGQ